MTLEWIMFWWFIWRFDKLGLVILKAFSSASLFLYIFLEASLSWPSLKNMKLVGYACGSRRKGFLFFFSELMCYIELRVRCLVSKAHWGFTSNKPKNCFNTFSLLHFNTAVWGLFIKTSQWSCRLMVKCCWLLQVGKFAFHAVKKKFLYRNFHSSYPLTWSAAYKLLFYLFQCNHAVWSLWWRILFWKFPWIFPGQLSWKRTFSVSYRHGCQVF